MNLSELVTSVADTTGQTKAAVELVLKTSISTITEAAKAGDQTSLHGFGHFKVQSRPAGMARNPRTGEAIKTAASKSVKFTMSKTLKDALNG